MVKNCLNRSIFTEVIVKINQGVRFLDHTVGFKLEAKE